MEEQPIDDLFARKLRDTEVTPGADAFSRLQSRMNSIPLPQASPKPKSIGWWYGLAAASILLVIFWISWSTQRQVDTKANSILAKSEPYPKDSQLAKSMLAQTKPQKLSATGLTETIDKPIRPVTKRKSLSLVEDRVVQVRHNHAVQKPLELSVLQISVSDNKPGSPPAREAVLTKTEIIALTAADKATTERTVVMTIAEPELIRLASVQPQKTDPAASASNLSQLLEKVRQLKQGKTFARADPSAQPIESKTSLKRFVNGVRESLRNENTLEL